MLLKYMKGVIIINPTQKRLDNKQPGRLRTHTVVVRVPVGTSQVSSSNPSGSEFRPGLKKTPSPILIFKAQPKAWPSCGNGVWH
jgi:hypothetical protein